MILYRDYQIMLSLDDHSYEYSEYKKFIRFDIHALAKKIFNKISRDLKKIEISTKIAAIRGGIVYVEYRFDDKMNKKEILKNIDYVEEDNLSGGIYIDDIRIFFMPYEENEYDEEE